ncbi:MAG: Asp-tRNA(Asn)/Glu-tRNA(Gln) amidotransferase subunit GatB [Candidatus Omnitrophica bacterium]|nr:Asp-tRNA(Asn)/Glu-tRNA(Gln) amidotransferase subunit GatB [Candidatus Omnitrophota bacterium]
MPYEAVIGLEVHIHLKTKTKAFCGCSTEFGSPPNSQTCPICLGFPGSLPALNSQALDYAIKVGLALNCKVQEYTKFDRKHYYYPDLPKNYQISQYDLPISRDGFLDIYPQGIKKMVRIKRAHLEEDAGKLMHKEQSSLVDFNRTGIPLLEIVSEPDINTPTEAYEYLASLKSIIEYLGVSDCDMEKGSLRCDVNISIRPQGIEALGTKVELKNMNSFKGVKDALTYEIGRQIEALESGGEIIQETRLWDTVSAQSISMRTKEEAKDYRYFPEPDLPPFIISQKKIEEIKKTIPELPREKMRRFIEEYGLSEYDAAILVSNKNNADYAQERLKAWPDKNKKPVANWLIGPLTALASSNSIAISEVKITKEDFLELVDLVENKQIVSNLVGKTILVEMSSSGKSPSLIIREKNLAQVSDVESLEADVDAALKENLKSVQAYKEGKNNALMFLVGQVMKKTAGRANPKVVQEILKRRLA